MDNIEIALVPSDHKGARYKGHPVLLKIQGEQDIYGVTLEMVPSDRILLTTGFPSTGKNGVDAWLKEERARTPDAFILNFRLPADNSRRAATPSHLSQYSIADIAEKIKAQTFSQEIYDQNGKADTNSAAFKRWFGDSKVVDEKGAPLVVYHGTKAVFDTFMPSKDGALGQGIYFAASKEYAQGVGKNVMPVYLSIKNPYIADGPITGNAEEFTNKLKQKGYDGIIHPGNGFYVVFEPTQIKSVYNKGTFDSNDANIYFQKSVAKAKLPLTIKVKNTLGKEVDAALGHIDYLEWSNERDWKKRRPTKMSLPDVYIETRGSFYYVYNHAGQMVLKKQIGSTGTDVRFVESIETLKSELSEIKSILARKEKINRDNFFQNTDAEFVAAKQPTRKPDYVSQSGSTYWYEKKVFIVWQTTGGEVHPKS